MGHNELRTRRSGRRREDAFIAVKFGALRSGRQLHQVDGRPEAVKTALAYTLQRLGTDYIGYQFRPARSGRVDRY